MENPSVLLVGAGQLGSRYLQGLLAIDTALTITVVEPSDASLDLAKERLEPVMPKARHALNWNNMLSACPGSFDLAIVATPANCRTKVVQEIVASCNVKFWILEKVLAQSCEQLDQLLLALSSAKGVWVNTPRRAMKWHQLIQENVSEGEPLDVTIRGGSWGIACNSIHFIDLVCWWTKSRVRNLCVGHENVWVESKRPSFLEFFGSVKVDYFDGSSLLMICDKSEDPLEITVSTSRGSWDIDENSGIAKGPFEEVIKGRMCYQSELTPLLVSSIIHAGKCCLPSLEESIGQHRPLLASLLSNWNNRQSRNDLLVPIT